MAIQNGSVVTLDYKAYVDGHMVDQTPPGQPLTYIQGSGQIIPGLEKRLEGLEKGDNKEITVPPEEAYGNYSEERVMHVPKEDLPSGIEPQVGMELQATSQIGELFVGIITKVDPDHVDVDFNHPMAGRTLRFDVEVLDVEG
ncbi:MAG: peptidylprolyl isomerase [Actinobacteria bacterium]|nr:peptidylprolyl isomerase [Actinomycetota bacterium]